MTWAQMVYAGFDGNGLGSCYKSLHLWPTSLLKKMLNCQDCSLGEARTNSVNAQMSFCSLFGWITGETTTRQNLVEGNVNELPLRGH